MLGLRFCARAFSSCGERGPLFIAVRGPLTIAASLVAEHRLQTRRLSSCGSWAQLLRGMWDLPRPGLEPVCPALAGGFLTTAPPGKPPSKLFLFHERKSQLSVSENMQIEEFLKNSPLLVPRGRFWLSGLGSGPGGPGRHGSFPLQHKIANHRAGRGEESRAPTGNAARPGTSSCFSSAWWLSLSALSAPHHCPSLPLPLHAQGTPTQMKTTANEINSSLLPRACSGCDLKTSPSGRREVRWGGAGG